MGARPDLPVADPAAAHGLLVRLPEEVDRVDDNVDDRFLLRACAGTPLDEPCAALVADPEADPAAYATITGFERWNLQSLSWLPSVSVDLLRVSIFLSAFSLLYITVSTVLDETYREQFFGTVLRELERAVGMRAVYLALRAQGAIGNIDN